ncbi:MAG: hypothetical protein IJ466_01235 [Clostridia bacterium]|nr:hypothetical protein [Clostridia bacterium]
MKKLLALLLAALLLACPALAEEENWYLETAKELILSMGELAKDEAYHASLSSATFDCIEPLKQADYANIISAWSYDVPPVDGVFALMSIAEGAKMSRTALDYLNARFPMTIPTMYNSSFGSQEGIAAAAMLSYSRSFITPENFAPCIITLELDKAAIAVSFCRTGDETITATACPLFGAEDISPAEAVQSLNQSFPVMKKAQLL